MKRFFTLIILLLLTFKALIAQEKIIEHTIIKGETVYSISKKYDVTIDVIYELNPSATGIIYPNEIIRIPDVSITSTKNNSITNASEIIEYTVKRGETKFGLSRRFGVSIAILEAQNPQIINMLQAGHIIKLDKTRNTTNQSTRSNEHVVAKGETLWGISKKYNVALNSLISANSNTLSEFLQIGQRLTIPDKNTMEESSTEETYVVKRGETKYNLAKRFNMTIAELEAKNPQIVPMLMAGHKLDINKTIITNIPEEITETISDKQKTEINDLDNAKEKEKIIKRMDPKKESDGSFIDYTIQPQETLYSLSKKANLTIGQMYNLNPKLITGVKKGDIIKMPNVVKKKSNDIGSANLNTSELLEVNKSLSLMTDLDFSEKNGVYFYLPFSERDFKSGDLKQKLANDEELQKYSQFYEGAQLAIDSAKALNLNFDVTLVEQKAEILNRAEISVDNTNTENTIIMPFLKKNVLYPEIKSNKRVPVIDVLSNLRAYPNATIYNSIPTEQFQKIKTLDFLASQTDVNIVVISTLEEETNKELILEKLPDAKFLKVDKAGFFKNDQLKESLKTGQSNYVILDSQQTIIFLNSTTSLMGQLSNYEIQLVLINSELLTKQNEASKMRYKILKLIYPMLASKDNLLDLKNFERKYELLYKTKPTKNAVIGFDVTLDIILRLSQKESFETSINRILNSEQIQFRFNYQKMNSSNYTNNAVYLMQYDSTDGINRID